MKKNTKSVPGLIYIDRQMHDDAIVISGSLNAIFGDCDVYAIAAQALEAAAREVMERGGIVGHIKASVSKTLVCMISTTGDKASLKESPIRRAKITLAAIVFVIEPTQAEEIVRNALRKIRSELKNGS